MIGSMMIYVVKHVPGETCGNWERWAAKRSELRTRQTGLTRLNVKCVRAAGERTNSPLFLQTCA